MIAAQSPFTKVSEWQKDINGIKVHYLSLNYPKALLAAPLTLADKIKYRLALLKVKLLDKGDYYDRSIFWKDQLLEKCRQIINEKKIKNLIVTGAPFRLTYYASQLKKEMPGLNFIVDFRDLWTADTANSSFSYLSPQRQAFEIKAEKETLQQADTVITVAGKMADYFHSVSDHPKYVVLPNGYDDDDLKNIESQEKKDNKLNLIFAGTLYPNLENVLFPFIDALALLKERKSPLYEKMNYRFIGHAPARYINYVSAKGIETVNFYTPLPLAEVQQEIAWADASMLFLNDVYSFSLSTKFCEYIAQKKKIVVFSNKGETVEYVLKNNLGYWVNPANPAEGLQKVYEDFLNGRLSAWNSPISITDFSINKLTDKLLENLV